MAVIMLILCTSSICRVELKCRTAPISKSVHILTPQQTTLLINSHKARIIQIPKPTETCWTADQKPRCMGYWNSSDATHFAGEQQHYKYLLCLEPAIYIFRQMSPNNKSPGYTFQQRCEKTFNCQMQKRLTKRKGDLYKPCVKLLLISRVHQMTSVEVILQLGKILLRHPSWDIHSFEQMAPEGNELGTLAAIVIVEAQNLNVKTCSWHLSLSQQLPAFQALKLETMSCSRLSNLMPSQDMACSNSSLEITPLPSWSNLLNKSPEALECSASKRPHTHLEEGDRKCLSAGLGDLPMHIFASAWKNQKVALAEAWKRTCHTSKFGRASHTIKSNSYRCLSVSRYSATLAKLSLPPVTLLCLHEWKQIPSVPSSLHRKRGKDADGLPVAYLWLCAMQLADAGACGGVAAPPYLEWLQTYHTALASAMLVTLQNTCVARHSRTLTEET